MISKPPSVPRRFLWVTLKAEEVIELKRIALDRDADGALAFFRDVVVPRVRAAALQRGIALDMLAEDKINECIPG